MYPHGAFDAKESNLTPAAIAHGSPLVLLTSDSVGTVNSRYAAHASACHRQDASGATKFACPGGSIMVYAKDGKTQIALESEPWLVRSGVDVSVEIARGRQRFAFDFVRGFVDAALNFRAQRLERRRVE